MWIDILVVFVFGGLVGLDTTAAWQVLFSHPLIACSILGVAFNEPQIGLFFGIIFELIWLYDIPVGGRKFPEGNLSSFIGLMIVLSLIHRSDISLPWLVLLSSLYTVVVGYLIGISIVTMRKRNLFLVQKADQYAEAGSVNKLELMHRLAIIHTYFHGAVWSLVIFLAGILIIDWILQLLPVSTPFTLQHIQVIFLSTGLAVMIDLFFSKKRIQFLILGIICGISLGIVF